MRRVLAYGVAAVLVVVVAVFSSCRVTAFLANLMPDIPKYVTHERLARALMELHPDCLSLDAKVVRYCTDLSTKEGFRYYEEAEVVSLDFKTNGVRSFKSLKLTLKPGTISPLGDPIVTNIGDPVGQFFKENVVVPSEVGNWRVVYSLQGSLDERERLAVMFYAIATRTDEKQGISCSDVKTPELWIDNDVNAYPYAAFLPEHRELSVQTVPWEQFLSSMDEERRKTLEEWSSNAISHISYENGKIGGNSGWKYWPPGFPR